MSSELNQEYVFLWKIQNFLSCLHKSGEEMDSPIFTLENLKKSKWFLRLYPRGSKEEFKEFISIYLYKTKNELYEDDCKLGYELEMIGADGSITESKKCENRIFRNKEGTESNWGFASFVNRSKITDKIKDLHDDVLTLRCRMFFNGQQSKPECEARTVIGVDQLLSVWNVRIPDVTSGVVTKEISLSKDSVFEVLLSMPEDEIKIELKPKAESPKPRLVTCKMSLVDAKGKVLVWKCANHIFDEKEPWIFPNFISKKFLDVNRRAFVESETICVLCKCVVSNGTVRNIVLGTENDIGACSTLQMQLKNMLMDNTYSDVKLKVDNEILQAHKCILAARSPVFSAMFQQDMIESKTNTVDIDDVEASTLKIFLNFVYTETMEKLDYEKAKKLLLVAEKYQVLTLKEKCVSFLETVVSLGNVLEVLCLADMVDHGRLKQAAVNVVISNSEVVLSLPEWSTLIQNNAKLATEIISKIVCAKNNHS